MHVGVVRRAARLTRPASSRARRALGAWLALWLPVALSLSACGSGAAGVAHARALPADQAPTQPTSAAAATDPKAAKDGLTCFEPTPRAVPFPGGQGERAPLTWVEDGQFHGVYDVPRRAVPKPRWLRFEVQPDETLQEIAERFGVSPEEIRKWNRLRPGRGLRYGQKLRIKARKFPRPRRRIVYWPRRGDTWASVAEAFGLTADQLRRFNRRKEGPLAPGRRIVLWAESALPRWDGTHGLGAEAAPESIKVVVPAGSKSLGFPARGRLRNGKRMPASDDYTLKRPHLSYASTATMAQLQRGIKAFRRRTGYEGDVVISSLSRRRGGRFPPHKSHQSGRDVDISLLTYPVYAGAQTDIRPHKVDWGANWALIHELLETGQVEFVFLDYPLQKKLYDAARSMGASYGLLDRVFQFPRGPNARRGIIRDEPGHDKHFHVRWRCGEGERRCRSRGRPRASGARLAAR